MTYNSSQPAVATQPNGDEKVTAEAGDSGKFDWNALFETMGDTAGSVWGAPGQSGGSQMPPSAGSFRQQGSNMATTLIIVAVIVLIVVVAGFIIYKRS